jgi:hypothetical protein
MQTDPIGYGEGLNWYNYVGGDPVNATDPSGMFAICRSLPRYVPGPQNDDPSEIVVNGGHHVQEEVCQDISTGLSLGGDRGGVGGGEGGSGEGQCSSDYLDKIRKNLKVQQAIANSIALSLNSKTLNAPNGPETGFWFGTSFLGNIRVSKPYTSGFRNAIEANILDAELNGITSNEVFMHLHLGGSGISQQDKDLADSMKFMGAAIVSFDTNGRITGCHD